jgi:hypothetical protein
MLKIVNFPDPILRQRMPEFDFKNPVMDPAELEKLMMGVPLEGHLRSSLKMKVLVAMKSVHQKRKQRTWIPRKKQAKQKKATYKLINKLID